MESRLLLQVEDGVAWLRFNSPSNYNALDEELLGQFREIVLELHDNPDVRVIVVGSAFPKAFVSGADIAYMEKNTPEKSERFCDLGFFAFQTLLDCPKPVIAAIGGHCLGGGLELALACDLRIASRRAKFGFPEVKLGILPGWGGLGRAAAEVGLARAKELMFTGDIITADDAATYGLVNHVVEPEDLEKTVRELAMRICSNAPIALREIKRNIAAASVAEPVVANAIADRAMGVCFASLDRLEGMRAFLEKRKPNFRGD